MRPLALLLTVFCFSLMGVSHAKNKPEITSDSVQVVNSEFGLFESSPSGEIIFVPTRTVPLIVGQAYGWQIVLETNKPTVKWREEFTLPAAPATWGDADTQGLTTLSKDKRVSVMELVVSPVNSMITNSWTVAEGDPKGHHTMRVLIDNGHEQIFQFDTQAAPNHLSKKP